MKSLKFSFKCIKNKFDVLSVYQNNTNGDQKREVMRKGE